LSEGFAGACPAVAESPRLRTLRGPCGATATPIPTAKVKQPTWTPNERTVWNAEEAWRFLAAAESDTHRALWVLALATWLRRGELLGLRWQDLDLGEGRLTVNQALVMLAGKAVIQAPKSKAVLRSVRLTADAIAAMRQLKVR
jgi:integrase